MKEIKISKHAYSKLRILAERNIVVDTRLIFNTVRNPDQLESGEEESIAQIPLTEFLVLRVVYREFEAFIVVITLYVGKRSRYEKN